ncbi:MAG: tRNA-dihydrouridine synthase, partial [Lachnospiraceae bacterium]|nr:tRNA-dihydrouridine synthase [Lachnospiraceae bacterium]
FAKEIREEIAKTCGWDFPVAMRYSLKSMVKDFREGALPGEEFEENGRDIEEGIEAAKLLEKYGYDALDVDAGTYDAWWWNHPPMYMEKAPYRKFAKIVKENVSIPVLMAGRVDNPDTALDCVENGICDIVSLGRPSLADPDIVKKIRTGKTERIRPCISCQEGCMGRIQQYSMINCAVNPQCGKERINEYRPVTKKKKVLIAASMITPAHLYIWDEPLNYIDVLSRMQIEKLILQYKPTMLLVEHDVRFRENVATEVIEIG